MKATELLDASRPQLAELLRAGHPVEAADLVGHEYRGISLGMPAIVDRLAWKTFAKVFHRDQADGPVRGWNLRLEQTGLQGELVPKQKRGQPFSFGHFSVRPVTGPLPGGVTTGLLLDYGQGGNHWWEGLGPLRDPVVALKPGRSDLLLGWSYLDLGLFRLGTPSYFVLERARPLHFVARPPVV